MMSSEEYLYRDCPACGTGAPVDAVRSVQPAENIPFDALRGHWRGMYRDKVFFSYHRCQSCGLLYSPIFLTDAQLGDLYSAMAPNMDVIPADAIDATQRGYFDAVTSDGTLSGGYLEIGPDVGYLVHRAVGYGNFDRFWLFEPNRSVHEQLAAATAGLPCEILTDMTDLSAVPDASIGLAVMVHVLDHLLDPMAMLAQIWAKLKPGGRLLVVTHNEASLLRRVMGTRWPPFCLQHPQLYNPDSMTRLLRKASYATATIHPSKNYFPIDFMVRQAAWTMGIVLDRMPLPKTSIGLKLGNIITIAQR